MDIQERIYPLGFDAPVIAKQTRRGTQTTRASALPAVALPLYYGRRVVTRSAWMQMKQPAWESMPVLDARALSAKQLVALEAEYDTLSGQGLAPLAQLNADPVRRCIDGAISRALGIPEFHSIRELLEREPGLPARDIAPRSVMEDDEAGDSGADEGQDGLFGG